MPDAPSESAMSALCLLLLAASTAAADRGAPDLVPATQVLWQRSLDDALALASAERRPLLVAINLDGESASDRIVVERYRDPRFVEWTRRFVCVIGHPLRHAPLDHDEFGRRVPCPRLGLVTCGEHMAIEPQVFDRYLGGERVSPRHALILPDGSKDFDLYYLFDLRILDRAVERGAQRAGAPLDLVAPARGDGSWPWSTLAGARSQWDRLWLEHALGRERDPGQRLAAVQAIGRAGDAGAVDALRLVLQGDPPPSDELLEAAEAAAESRGIEAAFGAMLRGILGGAGAYPGSPDLGLERRLLPLFARHADRTPAQRTLLLSLAALGGPRDRIAAREGLASILPREDLPRVDAAIAGEGGALELLDLLWLGREFARLPPGGTPPAPDAVLDADALVAELEAAESELTRSEDDPRAAERFGMACLRLAQERIRTRGPDIELLLRDAEAWLARAARERADDDDLALARARVAYQLSLFGQQAELALPVVRRRAAAARLGEDAARVLARWPSWGSGYAPGRREAERAALLSGDDTAIEALRWVGDADARMIDARAGGEAAAEAAGLLRGARALSIVAASIEAGDVDFTSQASMFAALGLARAELAALQAGLERRPESQSLRDALRDALLRAGRVDLLATKADWIAARAPDSAACAWYAGYAWFLRADSLRRQHRSDAAIAAYDASAQRFERSQELEPTYADSVQHYAALGHLGRGFAHLLASRREAAAEALATALALRPSIGDVRDGLDREALDLVDGALEWTADGPSPVDPLVLCARLERAAPGDPRWAQAVADSALREGLRSDGRSTRTRAVPAALRAADAQGDATVPEPTVEGDRDFEASIAAARRALAVADSDATRRTLAQSLATHAERLLLRERGADAAPLLREAARLLGADPVPEQADAAALGAAARALRERLGPARPVFRPGR